ncbi:MAG: peptide chain release factor N(5)-glutamine methyltransferase [Candidatus Omnitrophica bacterium]|jgi:release factor glutamine methyltransferase|nr:peptide chain release factor N(5)-glutamine methyltransferase [Candidatus Omnitrophota bacterium]
MNEAELLFSEILKCNRSSLYLNKNLRLNKTKAVEISHVLKRRITGEPIQYILGKTEFMGMEFKVTPDVLIPRPETEILVEVVIKLVNSFSSTHQALKILDIGTGSGCIAISLAKLLTNVEIYAVDVSEKALQVAKENAKLNKVKINFFQNDVLSAISFQPSAFSLIVSNPPYVRAAEINQLQIEVQREPHIALDGGRDGLDFYRDIIKYAARALKNNGYLALEIGFRQLKGIKNIFHKSNKFEIIEVVKDYNYIERVVIAKLK